MLRIESRCAINVASSSKLLDGAAPWITVSVSVLLSVGCFGGTDSFSTFDRPCAVVAIDIVGGTVVNSSDST